MSSEKSIQIRFEIKERDEKNKFLFIHNTLGSKFWAETLRHCVNLAYDTYHQTKSIIELDDPTIQTITKLIRRPDIQSEILTNSVKGFVQEATKKRIKELQTSIKGRSIYHWKLLTNLDEEEKNIAGVFVELQKEKESGMITLDELAESMNLRNQDRLLSILNSLVFRGMINKEVVGNSIFYYAEN